MSGKYPREDSRLSLLRHGHASLCASSPKSTPVTVDLLVLTKATKVIEQQAFEYASFKNFYD